jgi:hypothetical protein
MSKAKKSISERAVDRLEEQGFLKHIRAEMKADVMQCLVDMEVAGEIPSELRIKRFSPTEEADENAIKIIHQYLLQHGFTHSLACLKHEVNLENFPPAEVNETTQTSDLAERIEAKYPDEGGESNEEKRYYD